MRKRNLSLKEEEESKHLQVITNGWMNLQLPFPPKKACHENRRKRKNSLFSEQPEGEAMFSGESQVSLRLGSGRAALCTGGRYRRIC